MLQQQLTANSSDTLVTDATISPDGKYLVYGDKLGVHLQLIETKETQDVPPPPGTRGAESYWTQTDWFPDSTHFLATLSVPGKTQTWWSVPILGGIPQQLEEENYLGTPGVSPDGSTFLYSKRNGDVEELWLMGSHGEPPRRVLTSGKDSEFAGAAWSPSSKRIAFLRWRRNGARTLEACDLNGGSLTTVLAADKVSDFGWVSPGRIIYSRSGEGANAGAQNLWEIEVDPNRGIAREQPHQFTDWSGFEVAQLTATADGRRLAFLRRTGRTTVLVGDLADHGARFLNPHRLTADDYWNEPHAWTRDSREVIYRSERTGRREIYRQALDGSPFVLSTRRPTWWEWARPGSVRTRNG